MWVPVACCESGMCAKCATCALQTATPQFLWGSLLSHPNPSFAQKTLEQEAEMPSDYFCSQDRLQRFFCWEDCLSTSRQRSASKLTLFTESREVDHARWNSHSHKIWERQTRGTSRIFASLCYVGGCRRQIRWGTNNVSVISSCSVFFFSSLRGPSGSPPGALPGGPSGTLPRAFFS